MTSPNRSANSPKEILSFINRSGTETVAVALGGKKDGRVPGEAAGVGVRVGGGVVVGVGSGVGVGLPRSHPSATPEKLSFVNKLAGTRVTSSLGFLPVTMP